MKAFILAGLLTAAASAAASAAAYAAASAADGAPASSPVSRRALPDEDAIRKAVRDTLAERPDNPRLHEADTLRANRYDVFARQVEDATVPDCLHPDGLKRQPTGIGPFAIGGLLALPFIAVAKVRGKCQ